MCCCKILYIQFIKKIGSNFVHFTYQERHSVCFVLLQEFINGGAELFAQGENQEGKTFHCLCVSVTKMKGHYLNIFIYISIHLEPFIRHF